MKPHGLVVVLGVALAAAVSCSDNSPVGASGGAGTGGGAGTFGAGGSFGVAGTSGFAGTFGVAGTSSVAGVGGPVASTGISGTTGAAGTPSTGCRAFGDPTLASGKCVTGAFQRDGVCTCQSSTAAVCGTRCVDVMNDDDNCGCCGNACGPTSTCNNGKCGPAPVQIVPPSLGCELIELTVRNGTLAWTDHGHGRVMAIKLADLGGSGSVIDASAQPTNGIAVAPDGHIFWLEIGGVKRTQSNGAPTFIATSTSEPIVAFALSDDGATVYYSTGNTVMRISAQGGPPTVVARDERDDHPMAVAVDGNRVMYTTLLSGNVDVATINVGKVASCGKEGPSGELINVDCLRVARSQGSLLAHKIVALPGRVLWADGFSLKTSETTGVNAPMNEVVGMPDAGGITGFAANPMVAYFSEENEARRDNAAIYRAVIGGTQVSTRIARGQWGPRVGAIDQNRVYWSTADCAIMATGL